VIARIAVAKACVDHGIFTPLLRRAKAYSKKNDKRFLIIDRSLGKAAGGNGSRSLETLERVA
jgi:hypothetical protein